MCWSKSECWSWRGAQCRNVWNSVSNCVEACLLLQWVEDVCPQWYENGCVLRKLGVYFPEHCLHISRRWLHTFSRLSAWHSPSTLPLSVSVHLSPFSNIHFESRKQLSEPSGETTDFVSRALSAHRCSFLVSSNIGVQLVQVQVMQQQQGQANKQ